MKSAILVEQTQTSSQEILEIKTDKARQSSFVDTPLILEEGKKCYNQRIQKYVILFVSKQKKQVLIHCLPRVIGSIL